MANAFYFIFRQQQLLLTNNLEVLNKRHKLIGSAEFIRQLPLYHQHNTHYVAEVDSNFPLPADVQLKDLKALYHILPAEIISLASRAYQLLEWDRSHQFCGACGASTEPSSHEHSRVCVRASCGKIVYPRISPVVIMAVERGDQILLARSSHFPQGIYSVLAGFVEAGETAEQAVHREVFEETRIKIENVRYFSSQSWPFPHSLMLGFQADYASGEIICDHNELEEAAFFHAKEVPKAFSGNISISQWLLNDFLRRHLC